MYDDFSYESRLSTTVDFTPAPLVKLFNIT